MTDENPSADTAGKEAVHSAEIKKHIPKTDSETVSVSRVRRADKSRLRDKKEVAESVAQSLAELNFTAPTGLFSAKESQTNNVNIKAKTAPMTALLFQAPDVSRAVRTRRAVKESNSEFSDVLQAPNRQAQDTQKQGEEESQQSGDKTGIKKSRRGTRGGKRQENNEQLKNTELPDESNEEQDANRESDNAKFGGDGEENLNKRTRKRSRTKTISEESGKTKEYGENSATQDSTNVTIRRRRRGDNPASDAVSAPKGSTRLEAKRQRRKEGREAGKRRHSISESEFLARRESVNRQMLVRERNGLNQIAVIEDGILVEHYVARHTQTTMVGNVYLGRVQNVLPSMEAAFVDIGKGRNAVLYAGEVNWDATGLEGKPRKIEDVLKSGDTVPVQVTKDPIGHKGARLTGQITLAGRHLVLVPNGSMTGISRKLPEKERLRLKKILKQIVPAEHGVIVRTAAEGASEEQLSSDVQRLLKDWENIDAKAKCAKNAPSLLKGEPELAVRVVRDVFNEDFNSLTVQGENSWETILRYVHELSPELEDRIAKWESDADIFAHYRVDEQLQKAFDRKVFLPSGGSLVIDRTEAMTVIDVNTGKFTGSSGATLEETVTKNNLEAAEEIVRQLRLRDIGGIVVIDFIDMVLEANRDLVLRRLIECLGRDRTRHQVAEVTSLGLVQMTRKRVGQGLVEAFSTTCEACEGRGYISHDHPIEKDEVFEEITAQQQVKNRKAKAKQRQTEQEIEEKHAEVKAALANIAAAAAHKHEEALAEAKRNAEKGGKTVSETGSFTLPGGSDSENADAESETQPKSAESYLKEIAGNPETAETVQPQVKKPIQKSRRVTSTGTVTPASSQSYQILSFPVVKKEKE